jgi:hypothetical protein
MNVTDTASAAESLLIDLQIAAASKFKVNKSGNMTLAGIISPSAFNNVNLEFGNGSFSVRRTDTANPYFTMGMTSRALQVAANGFINFSGTNDSSQAAGDAGFSRAAVGVIRLTDASSGGGAMQFTERTAPTAPSADNCILFSEDNGAGKTRLVVRFASGADVVLATQA